MNQVPLTTLILRVRQLVNAEGALLFLPDVEIADKLQCSLATEFYDLVRQSLGDQYFRKPYIITTNTTQADPSTYDLPGDFLSVISVDAYLGPTITPTTPRINGRRYMEEERNLYSTLSVGWLPGAWILYSLVGNQIRFQPPPSTQYAIQINYQPTSPALNTGTPAVGIDDINGWSEPAVCDAAEKCAIKMNRLDLAGYLAQRRERIKGQIRQVLAMRHAGEPERPHFYNRPQYSDGFTFGWNS